MPSHDKQIASRTTDSARYFFYRFLDYAAPLTVGTVTIALLIFAYKQPDAARGVAKRSLATALSLLASLHQGIKTLGVNASTTNTQGSATLTPSVGEEILLQPNFYAPIVSSVVVQVIGFGASAAAIPGYLFFRKWGQRQQRQIDSIMQFQQEGKRALAERQFYQAAEFFYKAAEHFYAQFGTFYGAYPRDSLQRSQLSDLYLSEAKCRWMLGDYARVATLAKQIVSLDGENIDGFNLLGLSLLALGERKVANAVFHQSLEKDKTQNDIYLFWAYCCDAHKNVIAFENIDYTQMMANGVAHLILRCQADSYFQLAHGRSTNNLAGVLEAIAAPKPTETGSATGMVTVTSSSGGKLSQEQRDYAQKALEYYLSAIAATPRSRQFADQISDLYIRCLHALERLGLLLDDSTSIFLREIIPLSDILGSNEVEQAASSDAAPQIAGASAEPAAALMTQLLAASQRQAIATREYKKNEFSELHDRLVQQLEAQLTLFCDEFNQTKVKAEDILSSAGAKPSFT